METVAQLKNAATRGDSTALFRLGMVFRDGTHGVRKNPTEAAAFLRRAAHRGHPSAMFYLGLMLRDGAEGVTANPVETVTLWREAAKRGDGGALFHLGMLFRDGAEGVEANPMETVALWRDAAKRGDPGAMFHLGMLLKDGAERVAPNPRETVALWRKAAKLGDGGALFHLGLLFRDGAEGVTANPEEAVALWREAARRGDGGAKFHLDQLLDRGVQEGPLNLETGVDNHILRVESVPERMLGSPSEEIEQHAGLIDKKYDVFISHAGTEKMSIAQPLFKSLNRHDIHAFFDLEKLRIGRETAPEVMERAMNEARIGVFILSPEFAGRKWPMIELRRFLDRNQKSDAAGGKRPVLLPVFYGLSVLDCRLASERVYGAASKYRNVLQRERFFRPERLAECSIETASKALEKLSAYSGVETTRTSGGSDLSSAEVVEETAQRILEFTRNDDRVRYP